MRTAHEVMEAARMGEPCTDEEMRCCIAIMRSTVRLHQTGVVSILTEEKKPSIRTKLHLEHFVQITMTDKGSWSQPMEKALGPHNMPGSEELKSRKAIAEKVVAQAVKDLK